MKKVFVFLMILNGLIVSIASADSKVCSRTDFGHDYNLFSKIEVFNEYSQNPKAEITFTTKQTVNADVTPSFFGYIISAKTDECNKIKNEISESTNINDLCSTFFVVRKNLSSKKYGIILNEYSSTLYRFDYIFNDFTCEMN